MKKLFEQVTAEEIVETIEQAKEAAIDGAGVHHRQCPFADCGSFRVKSDFDPEIGSFLTCDACGESFS